MERLRHLRVAEIAGKFPIVRALDLGCSLGQLTQLLARIPGGWFATDLAPAAVARARTVVGDAGFSVNFFSARSTELPLRTGAFHVIVASDGLYSWDIAREDRAKALSEIHRCLARGGHAVLTEHMRRRRFDEFVSEIRASPLSIERTLYFHDRPSYQLESWLKSIQNWRLSKVVRGSVTVAQALTQIGRLFGTRGARHICVIARRD